MLKRPVDDTITNDTIINYDYNQITEIHNYCNHDHPYKELSEISEPATKLIKIEDNKTNELNYIDKCIQVDSPIDDNQVDDCIVDSVINEENENNENAYEEEIIEEIVEYCPNDDIIINNIDFSKSEINSPENVSKENESDDDNDDNSDNDFCPNESDYDDEEEEEEEEEEDDEEEEEDEGEDEEDENQNENEENVLKETVVSTVDSSKPTIDALDSNDKIAELKKNEANTEIEYNDEASSSSSGVLSITNSLDEITTNSSNGSETDRNGPLRSLLKVSKDGPPLKKKVIFNNVTVFYFKRSQGFTCVPSQGGSTLGMENTHSYLRHFTLETHAEERKRAHREILLRQKRFAKINKQSSTSESEDESCDEFSDLSDIDLENDSCYFLQPVPIKQRRALLRASGVRKIETKEKEECRNIRMSREFCGCDCRIYCNPALCSCYQAGIKCQVDRMSFPCGCTRDGCSNTNGRIEFNQIRVRTHFMRTIMRLKEKTDETDANVNINQHHSKESVYLPASNSTTYDPNLSAECNQVLSTPNNNSNLYTSLPNHYVNDSSSHMVLNDNSNNSFMNSNCINVFNNDYSPDNSSYSENSEYTSDDFEEEYEKQPQQLNSVNDNMHQQSSQQTMSTVSQQSIYPQHHSSNYVVQPDILHNQLILPTINSSIITVSNTILPPFPTISCEIAGSNNFKQNHCISSYQTNIHLPTYDSFTNMTNNISEHHQQTHPTAVYTTYEMVNNVNYNYDFSQTTTEQSHQHHLSSIDNQFVGPNENGTNNGNQQHYIDLSLSIASSSSAESMLSAANNGVKDSRLTPISFTHIPTMNTSLYEMTDRSNELCAQQYNDYNHLNKMPQYTNMNDTGLQSSHSQLTNDSDKTININEEVYGEKDNNNDDDDNDNEIDESKQNINANNQGNNPEDDLASSSDNFGEIIKKSMVESVTA